MDFIEQYWIWFGIATFLLVLEALVGSFRFLPLGIAAIVVGILNHLFPYVTLPVQALFFVVLGGGFVWVAQSYLGERKARIAHMQALYRDKGYVGKELVLVSPIVDGRGTLNIEEVVWQLNGPDCDSGQRVRVTDMGQGTLTVECA